MKSFLENFLNVQCLSNLFKGCSIKATISCSKLQLSARMKRKKLSLNEKMKVIDYADKNSKMGCWIIADNFSIGKTCVSNILRNTKTLQMEYEFFTGNCRRGKKSKQRLTAAFFVASDGSKIVTWESKSPRCFKNIHDKTRPSTVQYFSNEKAWMRTEIMEDVLRLLDCKFLLESSKIILFHDNAYCHPETLQNISKNIKLILLPKSTTSRLQLFDGGIISAFKGKYRERLLKYVVSRTDEGKNAQK